MSESNSAGERESQIDRIIADYLEAQRLGHAPNREDLLRRHADFADELRSFFADQDRFRRLAEPIGPPAGPALTVEGAPTLAPRDATRVGAALGTVRYFGDYELLEEIARGGMGVVYRARQVSLNRTVALKMILTGQLASAADVQRFRTEAEAAANLDHPNILPVYEVGEHEGQQYFSMKLVDGGGLGDRLATLRKNAPTSTFLRSVANLIATVARAVHHANLRGILHRDLKPANILLDSDGTPYVTDFGLAKRVEGDSGLTQSGAIIGTPSYMAPEQARAEKQLSTAVDVYALGAILYECLTGRPPFSGTTPLDTVLQVLEKEPARPANTDRDLATVAMKCLEKDPGKRYESAAALADDLDRWRRGEPIAARPTTTGERAWRWCRRNSALAAAASLAGLALLAVTVVSIVYAADRASAARRVGQLNDDLFAEGQRVRTEAERAQSALRETNRILATVAVDRAQNLQKTGETGQALLQLVEGIRFAHEAGDPGLERNARTTIGLWQSHIHRLRSIVPTPKPAEVKIDYTIGTPPTRVTGTSNYSFNDIALSPDGRAALIWSYPEVRIVETATGRPLGPALKGFSRIANVTISGDGKTVAVANIIENQPGKVTTLVTCWDVATGKSLGEPINYSDIIEEIFKGLALSPDGKTLLIGDETLGKQRGQVKRWDVASGKEIGTSFQFDHRIWMVAYSPDGRLFAVGVEGSVRLWDAATGQPIGKNFKPCGGRDFAFSADSKRLLTSGPGGTARLWDVDSGNEIGRFEANDGEIGCVAISPDGQKVATGAGGLARLWDVATQKPLGPPMMQSGGIRAVAFRQDGQAIVTALFGATIEVWDLAGRGRPEVAWKTGWQPQSLVSIPMAFYPDGHALLTASGWGVAGQCWDARKGALMATLANPKMDHLVSVSVSPDGRTGLTAGWSHGPGTPFQLGNMHILQSVAKGEIFRWDLSKGTNLGRLAEVPEEVMYATYARNGQAVLVVSAADLNAPTTLRLFDAVSGTAIGPPVPLGNRRVGPVAVSPDGQRAVSGMGFGQPLPQLWDAINGKPIGPPLADAGSVSAVAFRPDGQIFATAAGNQARFWDAATGAALGGPLVHQSGISAVAFSPDSTTFMTSCNLPDGTGQICFWDASSGQAVLPPRPFPNGIVAIAFRPDGQAVAVATDWEIRIWPLATPAVDDVERLRHRFQVWTGMELRDVVGYQPLNADTWLARMRDLEKAESGVK